MKKLHTISRALILVLFIYAPYSAFSQCESFGKKCATKLAPYFNSGQIHNTVLLSDDQAKLSMTFYRAQNYRVLVCSQEALGEVTFALKDMNGNVIFSNKGYGNFWDFAVETTQELTIEVKTPKSSDADGLDKSGCVSIMVGFKQ